MDLDFLVSTGLLVFPTTQGGSGFSNLQVQAMSLYLASAITSQITLTFGGSLFPGALGSMLIEVLPFLRGIATSIQQRLGDDNPNLLPTVVAAYTLTSFITGAIFVLLGVFRCGRLVEYFPRTVLMGTIGAIGLSLFLLGLELTLPSTAGTLTLSSAGAVLFSRIHTPLLLSSFVPALFLSVSIRMPALSKATRGFTDHALYVPVYMFFIAGLFWTVAAGAGYANVDGMTRLSSDGWLFTVEESVEWSAMSAAIENIVLLVVIGVLNLPIYIPAMALVLDVPSYNMNHELIGHGVSNIFAGAVGTIPNLVVLSNTRFFTHAGGGRFEGTVVILLTIVLFFVSSRILPYVPTILASTLVLFVGIELMAEGLWESIKSLLWCEYAVVLGTLLACTFVGFAPGFGIGLGLAVVVHFAWCVIDSMPRIQHFVNLRNEYNPLPPSPSGSLTVGTSTGKELISISGDLEQRTASDSEASSTTASLGTPTVTFIKLSGYAFFAGIPSLERQMKLPADWKSPIVFLLDFTDVHRVETSVAQYLERKASEYLSKSPSVTVVVAGVTKGSGVHADLERGRAICRWECQSPSDAEGEVKESGFLAFTDVADAVRWVKSLQIHDVELTEREVFDEFCRLIGDQNACLPHSELPVIQRARQLGIEVRRPSVGDILAEYEKPLTSIVFVIYGRVTVEKHTLSTVSGPVPITRPCFKAFIVQGAHRAAHAGKDLITCGQSRTPSSAIDEETTRAMSCKQLMPGDCFGIREYSTGKSDYHRVVVTSGPCWIVEVPISHEAAVTWAMRVATLLREGFTLRLACASAQPLSHILCKLDEMKMRGLAWFNFEVS
ncbi:sulfate transporter family-domain-containing protein [Melanogaster broomeanus]|nr:sulfate transporter family-domain-containing protein [Melanogaster broomeanus]